MARSDGTVYIDTLVDTKGFGKGMNSIQKQMGGLSGAIGKLGLAITATFAVSKLIKFGKEAIELGSDLQEVQNVVDVTFSTMSDKVNEFAQGAAEAAGLSEVMAKRYMGTFGAMSKAFGFVESEAYAMSETLTQMVGDVASFYNLSQDEAYTKLKSVFTGETESLKDLGVVMTQSALDAFAMANGYGKTTKAMTEQEKVALRYAFVLDQLSAASGDFQRTSDSWANQTRILALSIETLKANIGQALINIFTPLLKIINQVVSKMAQLSRYFVAFSQLLVGKSTSGGGGSPGEALGEIESGYDGIADATNEAAKAQKKYVTGLDEIRTFSPASDGASATGGIGGGINIETNIEDEELVHANELLTNLKNKLIELQEKFPILKNIFSIIGKGFDYVKTVALDLFNLFTRPLIENKDGFLVAASNIVGFLHDAFLTITSGLNNAMQYLIDVYKQNIQPVIKKITDDLSVLVGQFLAWFNEYMKPVLDRWGEKFDELWQNHIDPLLRNLAEFFGEIAENIGIVWDKFLAPFISWIATNIMPAITPVIESIGNIIMRVFGTIADIISGFIDVISGLITFIVGVFTGDWDRAWEGIKDIFSGIWDACESIITTFSESAKEIFNILKNSLNNVWNNIKTNATSIWTTLVNSVKSIVTSGFNNVRSSITTFVNSVKTIFLGLKNTMANIWNGIKNAVESTWSSMTVSIKNSINNIIYAINVMINGIVNGINGMIGALNGLRFSIPNWIPGMGGRSFGLNIGYVSAPQIPYLATGAVIPPNSPFMAVLGDQKHGTNIEAPLDTIKQAVREVIGNGGGSNQYQFTAQINRRTLFDEIVEEAKLRQTSSGRNPFDLA